MTELGTGLTENRARKLLTLSHRVLVMLKADVAYRKEDLDKLTDEIKSALVLKKNDAERRAEALLDLFRIAFRGHTQDCIVNDPVAKHGCDCGWEVAVRIKSQACQKEGLE